MKIAIAGAGSLGRYFVEEIAKSPHHVVILTREAKDYFLHLEQRVIPDYSVDHLSPVIEDCDALVSTLHAPEEAHISAHLALLEACKRSTQCKRFIPSEWAVNIEDFPDQPTYLGRRHKVVRNALRDQDEVKWTLVSVGWFTDYLLPAQQQYFTNLGDGWLTDNVAKVFDLYGDGLQHITLTSARDVARAALAMVVNAGATDGTSDDSHYEWTEFTHLAGQTLTYVELYEILKQRDPKWTIRKVQLTEVLDAIVDHKDEPSKSRLDYLRVMGFTSCNAVPQDRCLKWDTGILKGARARNVEEFLDEAEANRNVNP
ncbi:hypothetical protein PV08_02526 [Exophiala spinifera]|uniref:NAD(P)-binding domain-containing protein n=1 Tax=Exophiala spinifera TaxID=91928 RepID=A0A0D2BGV6_9EURO|nr:uncharacterized protein PV08_02526 [Exophiala spinifera]KIW18238.1 hypothetical protein PV08_02526 [Exophiala spinifera]